MQRLLFVVWLWLGLHLPCAQASGPTLTKCLPKAPPFHKAWSVASECADGRPYINTMSGRTGTPGVDQDWPTAARSAQPGTMYWSNVYTRRVA